MEDNDELVISVKVGDAIKLQAVSEKGTMLLERAGSDVWVVERIHMNPLVLNFNPGILASSGPCKMWIKIYDEDITFEPCVN